MENDNQISISSLSEYAFCPRRFYLMYIEKQYEDNEYTIEGAISHKNAHKSKIEKRGNFIKISDMLLYSNKYNLIGKSDIIEFTKSNNGIYIPLLDDKFTIYPIEYKHGIIRNEEEYNIQLCAQCLCLEEMFNCNLEYGAIYYINSNIRQEIRIDNNLRIKTINIIKEVEQEFKEQKLLSPNLKRYCKKCSLYDLCNPNITIINKYISDLWEDI